VTTDSTGGEGALPPPLLRYLDLFRRGEYWECHEALEGPWREDRSGFYHGLILFASAFVHARRDTPHGIRAQLRKAEERLGPFPSPYLGLDVEEIRDAARRCRQMVAAREETPEGGWLSALPVPELEARPERVRGDEPELSPPRHGSVG